MDSDSTVKKMYEGRPQGRPKLRFENDVRNDLEEIKLNDCRICIRDRNRWKGIAERPRLLIYEVVAPEEEGEEEESYSNRTVVKHRFVSLTTEPTNQPTN
jgi:hypothetical protein